MAEATKRKKLTENDLRRYASLAKIKLDRDSEVRLTSELGEILSYFEKIKEVKTDDIEPTYSVAGIVNRFRDDRPGTCLSQEEAIANSGEKEKGYIRSPKAF
ncbi:MAG: Asp-tRNA(Asn)/Glu-tRNA(Gln) amidotransferase subunit GatC [Thermoproteota archaeon]